MRRKEGLTLVELLVVVAIIGILAAIVVPNVTNWIARARMTRAIEEIRGADLAMTKMLTDANVQDFRQFLLPADIDNYNTLGLADQIYVCTYISYRLLRLGRGAMGQPGDWHLEEPYVAANRVVRLNPQIVGRLGYNYIEDLGQDPWGKQYKFWFGPWRGATVAGGPVNEILFRSWRFGEGDITDLSGDPGAYEPYVYDATARNLAEQRVPGAPREDGLPGFPAPVRLPVYIFSTGANQASDQEFSLDASAAGYNWPTAFEDIPGYNAADPSVKDFWGGGDDINNWDSEAGWAGFYS